MSRNLSRVAGLAFSRRSGELLALLQPPTGNCVLASVDKTVPDRITRIVATLPRTCLGDGLALDDTDAMVYIANEGTFVPGNGRVYAVNITTGKQREVISHGVTATDGAYFEPISRKVYVSEFMASAVLEIDPASGAVTRLAGPHGVLGIDDFTVQWEGAAGPVMYGSSMDNGKAFRWGLRNSSGELWATGITSPTSVRPGCPGLGLGGWFVTEGGSLSSKTTSRRVLYYPPTSTMV